ncbi:hypothetical protein D3C72_1571060 [compost metagenome]
MDVLDQMQLFRRSADDAEPPVTTKDARLSSRPFAFTMSDAIVRVRPFDTQYRDGPLVWELLDLVHAQIEMVNRGVLVRGGMTIGKAYVGYSGRGPVFGPAVAHAYEIETNEAVYPRIVVDDRLIDELRTDPRLWREGHNFEDEMAAIDELLAIGDDGTRFIDYLSQSGEFDDPIFYLEFLQRHAALIRAGRKAVPERDRKTRRKYEWLARYHNTRVLDLKTKTLSSPEHIEAFIAEFEVDPETFYSEIVV